MQKGEDDDIYKEYLEMAQRRSERLKTASRDDNEDAAAQMGLDADDVAPKLPGLEEYF